MACRSASRTQDAIESIKNQTEGDNNVGELVFKHLELSFLASVRKCAKEILHTEKRIDILVNNAGESCCEHHNNIYYYIGILIYFISCYDFRYFTFDPQ